MSVSRWFALRYRTIDDRRFYDVGAQRRGRHPMMGQSDILLRFEIECKNEENDN